MNKEKLLSLGKRGLLSVLVFVLFFLVWRDLRAFVLTHVTIPIVEYTQENCDTTVYYHRNKDTTIHIYLYDYEREEYEMFDYNSPAGFYFLLGLLIIILLNGNVFHYKIWAYFHFPFWFVTIPFIWLGTCYSDYFLHFNYLGIRYVTPFITFLLLALLISPNLRQKLRPENES